VPDVVMFKVENEIWHDKTPSKPVLDADGKIAKEEADKSVPYTIIVGFPFNHRHERG
jgi:hypothetical protein